MERRKPPSGPIKDVSSNARAGLQRTGANFWGVMRKAPKGGKLDANRREDQSGIAHESQGKARAPLPRHQKPVRSCKDSLQGALRKNRARSSSRLFMRSATVQLVRKNAEGSMSEDASSFCATPYRRPPNDRRLGKKSRNKVAIRSGDKWKSGRRPEPLPGRIARHNLREKSIWTNSNERGPHFLAFFHAVLETKERAIKTVKAFRRTGARLA